MKKLLPLLFIFSTTLSFADDMYPFKTDQEAKRFAELTQEIRCVVCQNQSLAESNAPLANDLRNKIYTLMLEKKTNPEIKNYLTQRYGEFILLQPQFTMTTIFLWLFPLFASVCAVIILRFATVSS